jgi:ribosomal protein S18 acetylase RimI-like enzyme
VKIDLPLTVRDLKDGDLPACTWSGGPTHLLAVGVALDRASNGEVDYLAVCPPSGLPVALGGVDYVPKPGAGVLWQLAVLPALQSCGIGTVLIGELEKRIVARGLSRAELLVEINNPRARALYERLGYVAYGRRAEGWDTETPDGSIVRYETVCDTLAKAL